MAGFTEPEVRRILADVRGKTVVAARLTAVERLRAVIDESGEKVRRITAGGLLELIVDVEQAIDVRARCAEVLHQHVGAQAFREWSTDWEPPWADQLIAVVEDRAQYEPLRVLAARALDARAMEDPRLGGRLIGLFAQEVSCATSSSELRLACLEHLRETQRGNPDWFAELRRSEAILTASIPWDVWATLDLTDKTLAAALAKPSEIEDAFGVADPTSVLEAAILHSRYDVSSARSLSRMVSTMPSATGEHAELVHLAVTYARARGALDLAWVEEAIAAALQREARAAVAGEHLPRTADHLRLWNELFRDGGKGLAGRLVGVLRHCKGLDPTLAGAWVTLHAIGDAAQDRYAEADRIAFGAIAKASTKELDAARLDRLLAFVAPERVRELQEARTLASIDVPTRSQYEQVYRHELATLPRRIRLTRLEEVLREGSDVDRLGIALVLLPHVIAWLPTELPRFEPLARKHIGSSRSVHAQTQRKLAPSDPSSIGRAAFDACVASIRPSAHVETYAVDLVREALTHGHDLGELGRALRIVENTKPIRELLTATLFDKKQPSSRRLSAWRALDELQWPEKDADLGGLLESILRGGVPDEELGMVLVEACFSRHPKRFAALRLKCSVPSIEHVMGREDAVTALLTARDVVDQIKNGEPLGATVAAIHVARAIVTREPGILESMRIVLGQRIRDQRLLETELGERREVFSIARVAFAALVDLADEKPKAHERAVGTLAEILKATHESLGDTSIPDLTHARDVWQAFVDLADPALREPAATALRRGFEEVVRTKTRNVEAMEAVLGLYRDTFVGLGFPSEAEKRLRETFANASAAAASRYAAFRLLSTDGRGDLVKPAVALFLDGGEDAALRALLGSVLTIWMPEAFESIVDMNSQPWQVKSAMHADLPASSLPANMPLTWLVAVLFMAEHDDPHQRAVLELLSRLSPGREHEWPRVKGRLAEIVGSHDTRIREGLRSALERPEPRHIEGRHAHAARLLALFGNEEDEAILASVAGRMWIERVPQLNVFWRPADKAPALGRYSFLEPYLEVGFGSVGRFRILAEAYALAAERAEAAGEGGTASRFAYEAFLLAPDDPRVRTLLDRLNS